MSYSVIGSSVNRVGGRDRVTGRQVYSADVSVAGTLHAKLVRVPCARARIVSIDKTGALGVPGVRMVFSGEDLEPPYFRYGPVFADKPIIAIGETKYDGDPVAVVVAETVDAAEAGARAVEVQYEELPAVVTIDQALDPGMPLVQDPDTRGDSPFRDTNTLKEWRFGWGDVETASADLVIENEYSFPMISQFAMEPFAFTAAPDHDVMTIYTSIQIPTKMQKTIADLLGKPLSKVRVVAPDPGGAFGGKQHPKFEPVLAYIAEKLQRPVRLELTLAESFYAVRRTSARVRVRSGFTRDGKVAFHDVNADWLIGAYADITPRIVEKGSYAGGGPYVIPAVRILSRALLSHTTPPSAFRGFGVPQMNLAIESQLDIAAKKLNIDPMEMRLRNIPRKGQNFLPDDPACDGHWDQVIARAAENIGWNTPKESNRGRGMALGIKMSATTAASYSVVRLHADGSATLLCGTSDMGQGARTVYAQIVSEELGVPIERIHVVMGDTSTVPFDLQTTASRSTVYMGRAVYAASQDVKRQLQEASSQGSDSNEEILKSLFGKVSGEIIGVGTARAEKRDGHPLGGHTAFYELVCTAVEIEVDRETGGVTIHKLVTAGDVGKALNPQHVHMQDDGAAVMGIGHALMEHLIYDERGRLRNAGALDYRIPTTKDTPGKMVSVFVENEDGPGPYGAKGCAESGLLAIGTAIANAVADATGVRIRELPLTPETIWSALQEAGDRS